MADAESEIDRGSLSNKQFEQPYEFVPEISPNELVSAASKDEAHRLVKLVRREHETTIKSAIAEAFENEVTHSLPQYLLKNDDETLRKQWLKHRYYAIVQSVVSAATITHQNRKDSLPMAGKSTTGSRNKEPSTVPYVSHSEQKRLRTGMPKAQPSREKFSIAQLFTGHLGKSDAAVVEVYVLHKGVKVKWVQSRSKRTGEAESIPTLTVTLADRTGVILMTFWRQAALNALQTFTAWGNGHDNPILVEISYFNAREDTRPSIPKGHRLHGNERTRMRRLLQGSVETITDPNISVDVNTYVRDFGHLNLEPPYHVNISGVVSSIGNEGATEKGRPMASFRLHESSGKYCECKVLGRHVDNTCLTEGSEVILFSTTAKSGANTASGFLWIFDETHIVRLREHVHVPAAKELVRFQKTV